MKPRPVCPIAVCVGTYGDYRTWSEMVNSRAVPSIQRQTVRPVMWRWVHDATLQEARNRAAGDVDWWSRHRRNVDWLCFLDADDELDEHYLEAMADSIADRQGDWLLQPATLGVHPDGREDPEPVVIPTKPLLDGNYMVIGTLIRREQFQRLGGFGPWEYAEDWDLWIRSWHDGAELDAVPEAIYRVHVRPDSRNNCDRATQLRVYHQIRGQHLSAARR